MLKLDLHKTFSSKKRSVKIACKAEFKEFATIAIYGQSGVGKSTILRMISGLETPEKGHIEFNNEVWFSSENKINLPISKRKVGFVFQEFNLFPNMTVEKNLKYASKDNKLTSVILKLLKTLNLDDLLPMYPNELSGGQGQRISIVRSLCQEPKLLLLDEPFSALDDDSIDVLIKELEIIQNQFGTNVIVISHRKDIVYRMADAVIHIDSEQKTQFGKPQSILK